MLSVAQVFIMYSNDYIYIYPYLYVLIVCEVALKKKSCLSYVYAVTAT